MSIFVVFDKNAVLQLFVFSLEIAIDASVDIRSRATISQTEKLLFLAMRAAAQSQPFWALNGTNRFFSRGVRLLAIFCNCAQIWALLRYTTRTQKACRLFFKAF